MLHAPNTLKVFVVQPVHIRMGIPWIACSAVDLSSIHQPKIGDNIHVCLRNVGGNVCIQDVGLHARVHLTLSSQRIRTTGTPRE
jgi:hypothetical protein